MSEFKKFYINPISDYVINFDNVTFVDQNDEFNNIKNTLNNAKNLIDNVNENDYSYISRKLDVYRTMKQLLSYKYKMQIVTNATIKIYEIIHQMNLIKNKEISVFCNAELPGGFIIGINHYIKTMYKNSIFKWVASSYLSEKGTLGDTYGIYKYNKNNWLMDSIMNGNIMDKDNIIELTNRVLSRFPNGVDLYTSDAGFDVSNNYNEQEEQTIVLNYGQILVGLLTLSTGGNLITKQFTYFTVFNRSLIMLLSTLFDKLYITKPATSRPLNSEIYIIGIEFKGINDPLKSFMINKLTNIDPDIPIIIYKPNTELLTIAYYLYVDQQTTYINYMYNTYIQKKMIITTGYNKIQEKWIKNNDIKIINTKDYIPYNKL